MAMCWLDLQEVTHDDGAWVWSDGSAPSYENWNSQYDQPGDDYGPEADAVMNAGDVAAYDGTWFDATNGDYAHALCNNNQADCADDIYLAPYMTGCPEGYDFPATEGACQRAADLSSGYEYGGAEGPYGGPDDLANNHPPCFWDGDEEEFCWTRPARGYCPQVSEEWGDLGAVCVRVGGCFETMGCQGGTPRPSITPAPTPSPASCTVRAYESVGCDCDPKSTCEGGMHDGSDEACCGTNGGYCGVEWRGTDGAEWIDIHDDACSGTDFFRVSPGCGIEVKTEWGEAYTYNEGSVLVCGYECEWRATPGCDTVRYLRIYATGPSGWTDPKSTCGMNGPWGNERRTNAKTFSVAEAHDAVTVTATMYSLGTRDGEQSWIDVDGVRRYTAQCRGWPDPVCVESQEYHSVLTSATHDDVFIDSETTSCLEEEMSQIRDRSCVWTVEFIVAHTAAEITIEFGSDVDEDLNNEGR